MRSRACSPALTRSLPPPLPRQVKGSGRFLAFCSVRPTAVLLDGKPVVYSFGRQGGAAQSLEVMLPHGYAGVPRQLSVRWEPEADAAAGSGGAAEDLEGVGTSR